MEKGKTALKVLPHKVALVTGVPCTRMCMDNSGEFLAVGASDGAITVFATQDLRRVSYSSSVNILPTQYMLSYLLCALMRCVLYLLLLYLISLCWHCYR